MNRALVTQLILAGSVLLLALALVVGITLASQNLQNTARTLTGHIQAASTEALRLDNAKAAFPVLGRAEETLAGRVVQREEIVMFLERLERTGQGADVEVLSVNGGEGEQRMTLSVKITGTFDAVMRTVGSIEHRPEDILLTSLTLDTEKVIPGGWSAAAVFTVGTDATH